MAVPWRERPPIWTAWPARPAASEVVAHATLFLPLPERPSTAQAALKACRSTSCNLGRRATIVRLATRAVKALRASLVPLRPRCAWLTALTARLASRFWQLSTAAAEVLDVDRAAALPSDHLRWLHLAAPSTSPDVEHVRIAGLRPRFVPQLLKPVHGRLFVRRHVRESDDRTGLRFGLRPGPDPAAQPHRRNRHAAAAIRRPVSTREEPHPVRPIQSESNISIDAQNGQAYHGRKTTTTNGTRPAVRGSRTAEEPRKRQPRRQLIAPRVRSSFGAASRARMLRAGTEAAFANHSVRPRP